MIVQDAMKTLVLSVSEKTPVREVTKIIFEKGISGVPVVKRKKLIGIITEEDILSHMYPTIQELIEDYTHVHDFNWMEENLHALIKVPVGKIMNKKVISVKGDTPLMKAQSLMLVHKFSHIPVIDARSNLIGIISQGDIFRKLTQKELASSKTKKRNKK